MKQYKVHLIPAAYNDLNDARVWYRKINPEQALRIIGYSTKDSNAAIIAFKRHFLNQESSNFITAPEKKIVYSLMLQSLDQ